MNMSTIFIVNVILMLLYMLFAKRMSYNKIIKKLIRCLIVSIFYLLLGSVKVYLIRESISQQQIILYILIDIVIFIGAIGIYRKNRVLATITFVATIISVYFDNCIDRNSTLPIIVFAIYIRTLLYFDIFWDGIIGILAYNRKIKGECKKKVL